MLKMAKKTLTERMGIARNKKKDIDLDDPFLEISRCNSYDFDVGTKDSDTLCYRERHLVPVDSIRVGMSRFNFLLETCSPGSIPDPLLISALLDLVKTLTTTQDDNEIRQA